MNLKNRVFAVAFGFLAPFFIADSGWSLPPILEADETPGIQTLQDMH